MKKVFVMPSLAIDGENMKEIWKDVVGYEGLYQVSNFGNVRSKKTMRVLKSCCNSKGYKHLNLCMDGIFKSMQIHRLVAMAFIPNPNNLPIINHKDENPSNNCVENLEWCDHMYNNHYGHSQQKKMKAMKDNDSWKKGQITSILRGRNKARRAVLQLDANGNILNEFDSIADAQHQTKIYNISKACRGLCLQSGGYFWKFK